MPTSRSQDLRKKYKGKSTDLRHNATGQISGNALGCKCNRLECNRLVCFTLHFKTGPLLPNLSSPSPSPSPSKSPEFSFAGISILNHTTLRTRMCIYDVVNIQCETIPQIWLILCPLMQRGLAGAGLDKALHCVRDVTSLRHHHLCHDQDHYCHHGS